MRLVQPSATFAVFGCWMSAACTPATPPPKPAAANAAVTPTPSAATTPAPSAVTTPSSPAPSAATTPSASGDPRAASNLCGGIAGLQCPAKQYCAFAPQAHCGAADMSGTCTAIPDVCMQLVDEVCGCDDKTYGNACLAAHAGVSVLSKGPCNLPDTTEQGGLCGTRGASRDCAPGLYCAYHPDCGTTDAGGVCTKKPTICTKIYKPVCGCDGKTYGSACTAAADGMSIVRAGPCNGALFQN